MFTRSLSRFPRGGAGGQRGSHGAAFPVAHGEELVVGAGKVWCALEVLFSCSTLGLSVPDLIAAESIWT